MAKLEALALGKRLTILPKARDSYGRTIALVFVEVRENLGMLIRK